MVTQCLVLYLHSRWCLWHNQPTNWPPNLLTDRLTNLRTNQPSTNQWANNRLMNQNTDHPIDWTNQPITQTQPSDQQLNRLSKQTNKQKTKENIKTKKNSKVRNEIRLDKHLGLVYLWFAEVFLCKYNIHHSSTLSSSEPLWS